MAAALRFVLIVAALVGCAVAYGGSTATPTSCSPTSANYPKIRINEVKSQGQAGTTFIELFLMAANIDLRGWEVGYWDKGGTGPFYKALGQGNCNVYDANGTLLGADNVAGGGASKTIFSFPAYVTCSISSMNAQVGSFILGDGSTASHTTDLIDYLAYTTGTCPITDTWAAPTGSCSSACVPWTANNTDISRSIDGSGSWMVDPSGWPTYGSSNQPGAVHAAQFSFTPNSSGFCIGQNGSITIKALDAYGNVQTKYVGTVTITPSSGAHVSTQTITFAAADLGQKTITLNDASGETVTLTAVDQTYPATTSTSGSYTFSACTGASAFDAVEVGQAKGTRIYTKLAGTAFNLDVLALDAGGNLVAGYTGTPTVELVDASGTFSCATASALSGVSIAPANYTYTGAGKDNGRHTYSFTAANAASNVRVRINGSSCSSDNFAIRPAAFALTLSGLSGPPYVAGSTFTLAAASGVLGYNGIPKLLTSRTFAADTAGGTQTGLGANMLTDTSNNALAAISSFPAASSTTGATSESLVYQDVGYLNFSAGAVSDTDFTAVDQPGDCIASSGSNALSGGQYGCEAWSAALNNIGRFRPDHFEVTSSVTPACAAGGFTYMDQDALGLALTLSARSSAGSIPTRYTAGYPVLAALNLKAVSGPTAATDLTSRVSQPALPTATWSGGQFTFNDTYRFDARNAATPVIDGPYDDFRLHLGVTDATDGVQITKVNGTGVTGTTLVDSASTKLRFGRLWFGNAFGSQLQDLVMPYEAQYWNGLAFVTNVLDSCTALANNNVALGNRQGAVTSANLPVSNISLGTFTSGRGSLRVAKPGVSGSVDVLLNLGAGSNCSAPAFSGGTAAGLAFLGGKWCGSGFTKDPVARATFGIYGNSAKKGVLYLREMY